MPTFLEGVGSISIACTLATLVPGVALVLVARKARLTVALFYLLGATLLTWARAAGHWHGELRGARVFVAGARRSRPFSLPCPEPAHALLAPLVQAQSFYRFANDLSIARGYDPDAPPHLSKVTETV